MPTRYKLTSSVIRNLGRNIRLAVPAVTLITPKPIVTNELRKNISRNKCAVNKIRTVNAVAIVAIVNNNKGQTPTSQMRTETTIIITTIITIITITTTTTSTRPLITRYSAV